MPRDLFGDVTDPSVRVGSRKWYTVPLSLAVHTIVLLLAIVIPLMATGALPVPRDGLILMAVATPVLPSPPPVRRVTPQATPPANRDAAPVDAPSTITPEPDVPAGFEESAGEPTGIVGGIGVEGVTALVEPPAPPPVPQTPVRIGGHIKQPEKIRDMAPVYPVVAQATRVEGIVIIEATIGTDGRVQNVRVLRSRPLLDDAALAAVRQWIYTPTMLNGVPVPVIMTVTVRFQLQ